MNKSVASFAMGLVGAGVGTLLMHGVVAFGADPGDPAVDTVPRVIPYEGVLKLDGQAWTGERDICFRLYDDSDNELWLEQHTNVAVAADGLFSVLLGQVTPLTSYITNGDQILLGITLGNCATGTPLAGRQLLAPAPTSLWTTTAVDFTAHGAVNAAATHANTTLSTGEGASFTGDVEVEGTTVQLGTNDGNTNSSGTANRALAQFGSDELGINIGGDFAGTFIESALQVDGTLISRGQLYPNATGGGGYPTWIDDADTEGLRLHAGTDNAFFGLYQRAQNNNGYNAVVYWGDDSDDDLIFTTEDNGDVVTFNGNGKVEFSQDVRFDDCRMCLYYVDGTSNKRYTCVRLIHNQTSPVLNLAGDVDTNDDFQFRFLCDGGATTSGTW